MNPSNGYSGLISFRIEWLDFLAVQGTLNGLLQHHNIGLYFHHQTHPHWALFLLWLNLFIPSGVISLLFSSIILDTYQPGEFIF